MEKNKPPIMLETYLRQRAKRSRIFRYLCAAGLFLTAILLRLLAPGSVGTVRAWVFGEGHLNGAVAAFYACSENGAPLSDAVGAFCIALDGD